MYAISIKGGRFTGAIEVEDIVREITITIKVYDDKSALEERYYLRQAKGEIFYELDGCNFVTEGLSDG